MADSPVRADVGVFGGSGLYRFLDDVTEITVVTGPALVGVLDTPRPPEAVPTTTSTSTTTTTSTSTTTTTAPDDEAAADDESDDEADEPEVSIPLVEGIGPAGEGRAYLPGEPPPGESCG